MSKKKTTEQFVQECIAIHGNKYDYSKVEYKTKNDKVCIICPEHGEFWQKAEYHNKGCNCPKCSHISRKKLLSADSEVFLQNIMIKHGDKYDYSKVKYINSKSPIEIICPIHGSFWQKAEIHLKGGGCPICRNFSRRKLLYNVAYYDVIESMVSSEEYIISSRYWHSMIRRCYSEKSHKRNPTYIGCSVDTRWLKFSNFKSWFDEHYIQGWCLDKDILVQGNKIYSPNTCCFVPNEINTIFSHKTRERNLPQGVVFNRNKKYVARTRIDGKEVHLGQFDNVLDAFNAYKEAKENWIKQVADKWKDKLEPRVYEALYNYQVEIND